MVFPDPVCAVATGEPADRHSAYLTAFSQKRVSVLAATEQEPLVGHASSVSLGHRRIVD